VSAHSILHVNSERGWRGGEAQTLFLASGLARRGHEVLVAGPPDSPLETRARAAGLPFAPLAMRGDWDVGAARGLAALLRVRPFDRIHYHTAHAIGIGALASLIAGRRPAVASRRVSFPVRGGFLGRLKYTFRVDRLIAVSEAIRRGLIARGADPARVVTIHSGIDVERFARGDRARFRAALAAGGWPHDAPLVGTAGHLAAHKGMDLFLAAAAEVARRDPRPRFVIVGTGAEEGRLRAQAAALGLEDRVLFAGFRDDMPDVFAGLDVFVLASHSGEGSPAVLKEAMAAGAPVAATALDGVGEIIEDARHGLLTPPGDAAAMARAIGRLLEDGSLRARVVLEARRRAGEFGIERMVEKTEAVYASLGGVW
jgi:L-malate glycosyltransferase